jgi:hypothetical protein
LCGAGVASGAAGFSPQAATSIIAAAMVRGRFIGARGGVIALMGRTSLLQQPGSLGETPCFAYRPRGRVAFVERAHDTFRVMPSRSGNAPAICRERVTSLHKSLCDRRLVILRPDNATRELRRARHDRAARERHDTSSQCVRCQTDTSLGSDTMVSDPNAHAARAYGARHTRAALDPC